MPLDGSTYEVAPDLTTLQSGPEGLRQLAYVLRHREVWPPLHRWHYEHILYPTHCGTAGCAIGIAKLMWPGKFPGSQYYIDQAARLFKMERRNADIIFAGAGLGKVEFMAQVTPAMVADEIDRYLEGAAP